MSKRGPARGFSTSTTRRVWTLPAALAYCPPQPIENSLYQALGLESDDDELNTVQVGDVLYAVELGTGLPMFMPEEPLAPEGP